MGQYKIPLYERGAGILNKAAYCVKCRLNILRKKKELPGKPDCPIQKKGNQACLAISISCYNFHMPFKYDKEVFISCLGGDQGISGVVAGNIIGATHGRKGSTDDIKHASVLLGTPQASRALSRCTNRSRIYILAHGIPQLVHEVEVYSKIVSASYIADYLKKHLTTRLFQDPDVQRLRISLLTCMGGLGAEEHRKFVKSSADGPYVDVPAFSEAEKDNFEASFAVMLCAQLYDGGAGIICDVVGRRDDVNVFLPSEKTMLTHGLSPVIITHLTEKFAVKLRASGVELKACKMTKDKNFKSLKSGSLKFIVTPNSSGSIVFYDEYEDFFYSFVKHSMIPTLKIWIYTDADQPIIDECISRLLAAAQVILKQQIESGEGEERPSKELERETGGHHPGAKKLSRLPEQLNADYLKISTILNEAYLKHTDAQTEIMLRSAQKSLMKFAKSVGATDVPEWL